MSNVKIRCIIEFETDESILLRVDGHSDWVPLSQVSKIVRDKKANAIGHQEGEVTMTAWIARKKGFDK